MPSPELNVLSPEAESLIARFENAWVKGGRPDLLKALEGSQPEERLALMRELSHADLEFRIKTGEQARTEDYLKRFPELAADLVAVRELIDAEIRFRVQEGCPPTSRELAERFPVFFSSATVKSLHANAGPTLRMSDPSVSTIPDKLEPLRLLACLSPPEGPGEIGRLNGYRVLKLLGEGGMGMVFEAEDMKLKRHVALKVMKPEVAAREEHRVRFIREAQTAAAVEHQHICPIYQMGEENGAPFIAMQYLSGYSLDQYLRKKGEPTIPQILRIASEMATGLAAAHGVGLVHRDIKPGNLWLEAPNGRVKILDFGLAKPVQTDAELTRSGDVVGTPAFMSPEQGRGLKVDHRTDLFSLGAVLYRLCTGKVPFDGPTVMAVLTALAVDEPIPVRELNPKVPPVLAELIRQLLAKDPKGRPQTAEEVLARLGAITEELTRPKAGSGDDLQPSVFDVPIEVSTSSHSIPFADLTEADSIAERMKIPGKDVEKVNRAAARRKASPRVSWLGAGLFLLVALGASAAAYKLYFETKDGTLVVEVEGDADVRFKKGELHIYDSEGKLKYTLKPGERTKTMPEGQYHVEVTGIDGLKLDTPEFTLTKDGATVRVRVDPNAISKKTPTQAMPDSMPKLGEPKFIPLFNGKNLDNWQMDGGDPGEWTTDNGTILGRSIKMNRGYLLTKKEYSDFTLKFEYSIEAKSNGGIAIRAIEGEKMPQGDGLAFDHPTIKLVSPDWNGKEVTGTSQWLQDGGYNTDPIEQVDVDKEEWQQVEVTVRGNNCIAMFNGKKSVELKLNADPMTYSGCIPGLKRSKGKVGFLINSGALRLRNVEINEIGDQDPDRRGAKYVLSVGGSVFINDQNDEIKVETALPIEPFTLTRVRLGYNDKFTEQGLANLSDCKGLIGLDFRVSPLTDRGLSAFAQSKRLKGLTLCNTQISDAGLVNFKGCKDLEFLNLEGTRITDKGMANFKDSPGLNGLVLVNTQVTDATLSTLKYSSDLGILRLSYTSVTDVGLANFKDCKKIHLLELSETQTTDAGLAHFKSCSNLKSLLLARTKVTNAGLTNFKDCQELMLIDLSNTRISDAGLEQLISCSGLASLVLTHTDVTDAGMAHLIGLKNLTNLDLRGTKVTAKGIDSLKQALPNCQIASE